MSWILLTSLPNQQLGHPDVVVYWKVRDGAVWTQGRRQRNADVETFEVRTDSDNRYFARDKNWVYHAGTCLKKIDRDSFELLGDSYYSRDKNLVYYEYDSAVKPLKGECVHHFRYLGIGYARDSKFAYYGGTPIRSCKSPLTFSVVETEGELAFACDEDLVFFERALLKGVDRKSWRHLEVCFSRDDKSGFWCSKKLPRLDVASWELVDGTSYSKDKSNVYVMDWRLPAARSETWRPISADYSTDGDNVYFVRTKLDGAHAPSFRITSQPGALDQRAEDNTGRWIGEERETPARLEQLASLRRLRSNGE